MKNILSHLLTNATKNDINSTLIFYNEEQISGNVILNEVKNPESVLYKASLDSSLTAQNDVLLFSLLYTSTS